MELRLIHVGQKSCQLYTHHPHTGTHTHMHTRVHITFILLWDHPSLHCEDSLLSLVDNKSRFGLQEGRIQLGRKVRLNTRRKKGGIKRDLTQLPKDKIQKVLLTRSAVSVRWGKCSSKFNQQHRKEEGTKKMGSALLAKFPNQGNMQPNFA